MLETGQSGQARKRSRACVGNAPGRCMTAQGGRDHVRACTCARYLGLGNAGNGWPNPVNTLSLSTFQSWARAPWPSRNRKQQWHLTALPGHMQVASWIHANGRLRQPRQPASSTWQSGKHLGAGSTRSQEIAKVPGFSDSPHGTRSLMCPHKEPNVPSHPGQVHPRNNLEHPQGHSRHSYLAAMRTGNPHAPWPLSGPG